MRNPDYAKSGKRLKDLCTKRGLSQGKLPELADLYRTYISGIERGIRNPSLKNIQKLAYALNVNPKDFFT